MRLRKTLRLLTPIALVLALGGCALSAIPSCKPVAPALEWYEHEGGGIYYPERSVTNLMLYIEQLNDCIDYHQINPG